MRIVFIVAALITSHLLVASLVWAASTQTAPADFIFLPGGDVGLGFLSHAGQLQWVEYAPWDQQNTYYAQTSWRWSNVLLVEVAMLVGFCVAAILSKRRTGPDGRAHSK